MRELRVEGVTDEQTGRRFPIDRDEIVRKAGEGGRPDATGQARSGRRVPVIRPDGRVLLISAGYMLKAPGRAVPCIGTSPAMRGPGLRGWWVTRRLLRGAIDQRPLVGPEHEEKAA